MPSSQLHLPILLEKKSKPILPVIQKLLTIHSLSSFYTAQNSLPNRFSPLYILQQSLNNRVHFPHSIRVLPKKAAYEQSTYRLVPIKDTHIFLNFALYFFKQKEKNITYHQYTNIPSRCVK